MKTAQIEIDKTDTRHGKLRSLESVREELHERFDWAESRIVKDNDGEFCITFKFKETDNTYNPLGLEEDKPYALYPSGFVFECGSIDDPCVVDGDDELGGIVFTDELGYNDCVWLEDAEGNIFLACD